MPLDLFIINIGSSSVLTLIDAELLKSLHMGSVSYYDIATGRNEHARILIADAIVSAIPCTETRKELRSRMVSSRTRAWAERFVKYSIKSEVLNEEPRLLSSLDTMTHALDDEINNFHSDLHDFTTAASRRISSLVPDTSDPARAGHYYTLDTDKNIHRIHNFSF